MKAIYLKTTLILILAFCLAPIVNAETIDLEITAGTDDATETAKETLKTTSDLWVYSYPGETSWQRKSVGLRFQDVDIPQGAVVIASYISIYPFSSTANDMNAEIYLENNDDSEDFVTNPHIISESYRPRTSSYTNWVQDDLTVGTYVNSPSLNDPLQELFSRPGWTEGNDLTVLMIANEDMSKAIRFWNQENWRNLPARLHIKYATIAGPDTTPPIRSNGQPTGSLPSSTNQTTISLDTDENAICRYSTEAGTDYDLMTENFSTTDGTSHSRLITALISGNSYTYYVKCSDNLGNKNIDDFVISFSVALPDTTPPVISGVQANDITSSSATINWLTDDLSNSNVYYGTTSSLGLNASNPSLVINHSISLNDLSRGTIYYYQVYSCNMDGYCSSSQIYNFTTTALTDPITIDLQITAGSNDAIETAREVIKTTSDLWVYSYPGETSWQRKSVGLRFQDVDIPQGAVVIASYISIYPFSSTANDMNAEIYLENNDDSEDFVTNPHIISESYRPRTSSYTNWVQDDLTVGTYVNSPSLNDPLQELFSRPGWTEGNDLTVLMIANEDMSKAIRFWNQENWRNLPARLHIKYATIAGPDTTPPIRSNGQPTGSLPSSTNQTTISLDTDENAICRYSTEAGTDYDLMTENFSTTDGTSHSRLITALISGNSYTYYVKCSDNLGNKNIDDFVISFSVALPDTTPPVISGVQANDITSSSATINWLTDDLSNSNVYYGQTIPFDSAPADPILVTSHSINLTGLSSTTTYYYQVYSCNSDGYCSASSNYSFTTTVPEPIPPKHIHLSWSTPNATDTTMTITWTTFNNDAGSVVQYGPTSSYGLNETGSSFYSPNCSEDFPHYIHSVELTGLTPNTTYHYRCGSPTEGWSNDYTFVTATPHGSTTSFTFGVIGDIQTHNYDFLDLLEENIIASDPLFNLHMGDIVDQGNLQIKWDAIFDGLEGAFAEAPLMPTFGNHDLPGQLYIDQFTLPENGPMDDYPTYIEYDYSFNYGNTHFTVLNSNMGLRKAVYPQVQWLKNDLEQANADPNILWKIVYFHHPRYCSPERCIVDRPAENSSYARPIEKYFYDYNVDLVLHGHINVYERSYMINSANNTVVQYGSDFIKSPGVNGTVFVVVGGAGAVQTDEVGESWFTAYTEKIYHVGSINIDNNTLHFIAKNLTGFVIDEFNITKSI